ncbi:MAG: HD domain-containing protein [Deferrisomatales bacterium]|nr:HD domain-containing protein [Deferrisomatales bacterium]
MPEVLRPEGLKKRLETLPGLAAARAALAAAGVGSAWLVGGAVRDAARGVLRPAGDLDLDLALPGDGRDAARRIAATLGGSAFPLDEEQGAWRVVAGEPATVDVVPLRAATVEEDLAGRDLTVNAVAWELFGDGAVLDPLGGLADLARGRARLCSPGVLEADPVRVLRVYRFAATLALELPPEVVVAVAAAAEALPRMPRERVRDELFATLDSGRGAWALGAMADHGVLAQLVPGFDAWKGFDQGEYHRYDLAEHALRTVATAEELAWHPGRFPFLAPAEPLAEHLSEPLEAGVTRRALLLWVALLHDVAKPATVRPDGDRLRFLGHEVQGGQEVYRLLRGLRLGGRTARAGQRLVAAHLRLFQLAQQEPPTPRARLRYLKDLRREVPEALLLALADEWATGPERPAWPRVSVTAGQMLTQYWQRRHAAPVAPLLRGRDLLALGLAPGPRVGAILRAVEAQERLGRVGDRAQALELARALVAEAG